MVVAFVGGEVGAWRVDRITPVLGETLPPVPRLAVHEAATSRRSGRWTLRGAVSNERYVNRNEREQLTERQAPLGRPEATRAALIPITKSERWWDLPQDERREIFEERSGHIARSLPYLPAVARRLHHGRDIGEPFDFLTWFEYAPEDADAFEELVTALRSTLEWTYVEREVDLRLSR